MTPPHPKLRPLLTVRLHVEGDVQGARRRAAQVADALKLSATHRTRFATAVSELARNAVMYAGGGQVVFSLEVEARVLWASVIDQGPGIPALDDVLAGRVPSTTGLGVGLSGSRRLVDAFAIETVAGGGTRVRAGQRLPADTDLSSPETAARLGAVASRPPDDDVDALQAQNQALVSAMADLARREAQLRELNLELEETNRGTVALYSDLENTAEQLRVAERQVRQLNVGLTERVRERTLQLSHLNAEMTAYTQALSRDIQEPLRRVQGFLGLLRRHLVDTADGRATHYLDVIAAESGRVGQLVEDLAGLTRTSERELRRDSVPLDVLIMQVRSDLAQLTRGRRVEWRLSPLPTVWGDQIQLRAAFTHVLHNALKFTAGRERALIEVGGERQGGEVVVWVRDNGVGFAPADAGRLFEVFGRLHGDAYGGAGLGLANVRRVMTRHGGRVWATGQVGEGATFFLAWPTDPGV